MKLAELRDACAAKGLDTKGTKAVLEARLSSAAATTATTAPLPGAETNTISYEPASASASDDIVLSSAPDIRFRLGHCLKSLAGVPDDSIRAIYLDPPFDSDRNYTLSVDSAIGFKDKWTGDEYERFMTSVIDGCYPKLAKNGTLFFHISAERMWIPEKILRAKFRFVTPIFWKRCRSKNNVKSKLGATIDILFRCTKIADPLFHLVHQPKDEKYLANSFKNKDERGNYALGHLITEPTKKGHEYSYTIGDRTFAPPSGWRIPKVDLEVLAADNRLHVPKGREAKLYKKIYLHENPGKPCTDLWDDIHSIGQGSEGRKYPTAKPKKLLERVILISTDPGDWVLDPMCGSGTTGAVAAALGRRCWLFDSNPDVIPIVRSRFDHSCAAPAAAPAPPTAVEDDEDEGAE